MGWQTYIPKVIIPNLPERQDRRERMIGLMNEYGIEATIWEAIKHEKGYFGLLLTMKEIFKWCLNQNIERVLILEDDCDILESVEEWHNIMDKCCSDLKNINWDLFYLGLQHVEPFSRWATPNLLPVSMGYSTHAVCYSKHAMEFFNESHFDQPIDNFWVEKFQKYNTSFCSYPMLCSQVEGYSSIYNNELSWKPFIEGYFQKHTRDILQNRFKTETNLV